MQSVINRPPIGGIFPLVVHHAGATPRHGLAQGQATAHVAILHGSEGRVVVLMADGNYGASITNAAEELVGFLYPLHLQPLNVALEDVRWIYRDSDGNWDEISPVLMYGTKVYGVKLRPLGARGLADALAALSAEGVSLSDDEKALLSESLGFEALVACGQGG
jgi:hypothetical protein